MPRLLALTCLTLCCACASPPGEDRPAEAEPSAVHQAPTTDPAAVTAAITALLDEQVEAWNEGDVERFMEGYWKDPRLRFASDGGVHRGWEETLGRYYTRYPDRAAMGRLSFVDLEVTALSADWAVVFGRFVLERESDRPTGLFTLLVENQADEAGGARWRIVADHTSTGEP